LKAVLAPVGTRGDVQPMVALGQHLRAAGHDVTLAVAENFRGLVEGVGLEYAYGGRDVEQLVRQAGEGVESPSSLFSIARMLLHDQLEAVDAVCDGADILVGSLLLTGGPTLAARRGIPLCLASYFPAGFPCDEHPSAFASLATAPRWLTRASWVLQRLLTNAAMRGPLNRRRRELGMSPIADVQEHMLAAATGLLATDAELAPPPAAWASRVHTTGFWFLDSPEPLPPALEAFLEAGDPPIYIGFGSMPHDDPATRSTVIAEACAALSCRAIVGAGWAGLGAGASPRVHGVGPVNHRLLFDRVAAVVHHGGAGTTAAAARAGVPQVIAPHIFDQFYWASRVEALGLGPAPLPKHFGPVALVRALRAALEDRAMREKAQRMGRRLRKYSGADRAVTVLEKVVAGVVVPPGAAR
jgi:vancomycin aglycone glucosyltransferase